MGAKKFRKHKAKPRPKVVINYPPVPTRKWIPPDQRKKPPKAEPKYVKPEGISQKLAISTLKKVWNKFDVYGDAGIIVGHFSQLHKRFTFKSNGYQGSCNSAMACIYSQLFKMAQWTPYFLDEILLRGDELYIRSTQQGDKCLIEVPPEKMYTSFFYGNQKITLFVSPEARVTQELTSASEEKAKEILESTIKDFLTGHPSGIFYIKEKYAAIWVQENVYYFFDPEEHDEFGNLWKGHPGLGVSFLGRFKKLSAMIDYLFKNFPAAKEAYVQFHAIPCGIARIVNVNTKPPETFEDLAPQDVVFTQIIEEPPPPPNIQQDNLEHYVEEDKKEEDEEKITYVKVLEISPYVNKSLPEDNRPSFIPEGGVDKSDSCRYPIPIPTYLKGEHARLTYYTEIVAQKVGILRGSTCQTNPNFSKYLGRQSMGNALSALIMLRICKSKHWVPKIVDTILKYGETLYRDAMLSIPRTHTLRLINFPEKIEYEGKKFTPVIDEYALVGQMQTQDYDVLDLGPALEEFLTDHDACIVLGPLVLAIWVEDGMFYMFDPNERDSDGKAIIRQAIVGSNIVNLDPAQGVACVVWCKELQDLVNLYVNNTEKSKRDQRFFLSKVLIEDYVEVSEDWYNFKGIEINKWILRGTFCQGSYRFPPDSRNTQGTANALVSLAMALLFGEEEWSSDTVDEILMSGDAFYRKSVEYLQEKGLFNNYHLMLSELNGKHHVRDKEAHFDLEECIVNGLVYAKNKNDLFNLLKGMDHFFQDNEYGVLTTRDISLPIWKKKEAYYYLDPYSRDDKGVSIGYGTSCAIRCLQLEDMAKAIEANLDPNEEDFFNITKVKIILYEAGAEGTIKPPLNNYTALTETSAILRSWISDESDKYEIRKGRQTVPMCLMGLSFNRLKPSSEWTKNDLDIILDKGDDLYVKSMIEAQQLLDSEREPAEEAEEAETSEGANKAGGDAKAGIKPSPSTPPPKQEIKEGKGEGEEAERGEEEEDLSFREEEEEEEEPPEVEIKITSENVKPELNVGPNVISLEFDTIAEGNIKESLKDSLRSHFEAEQTDDNFNQEALLETKHYVVALWRDDKAFYLFDSKPRDKNGEVIGREDWDPEPSTPEPEPEEEEEEGAEEEESEKEDTIGNDTEDDIDDEENLSPGFLNNEDIDEEMVDEEEEIEEEQQPEQFEEEVEEEEPEVPSRPKKSPSYWMEQEKTGRACTVWFTNLEDLVEFVYNNIPVKDRLKGDFTLKAVTVSNNLKTKNKYNVEDEMPDAYAGDWYDFKELESGVWILRGTLDLYHDLFPISNRGKQGLTASIVALAIVHLFEVICFTETTPDSISVYGDKLFTFLKRQRKKWLRDDPNTNLKPDEIDWLVEHEELEITDIPTKICISKFMADVEIEPDFITGDIKAQDFEELLDVKRGLEKFFESAKYGVLYAKGLYVAVWRGQKMYYMADGMKRGPNGIQSTIGSGCIMRFLDLEKLTTVFLKNLPILGKSEFTIHKINLSRNLCPRAREPKCVMPVPKAVPRAAGLKLVLPGKKIIRGSISQEDPRFGKGPNVMSAPIAVVALTMSLIHKPETWARPIIDDIVVLGSELYEDSVNELGFDFNPWEDTLDIYRVKRDYKLGVVKANCELRPTDQRGYIDNKESGMQNLRQGMERFFEENTHGILVTEPLVLGFWEQKQDDEETFIYIFDPNPRSSTGMPLFSGTACALSFINAKMASDHVIGCIMDPLARLGEFVLVPVEIVVGNMRTHKKPVMDKSPTRSSINTLPRCSKLVASEQKRKLRKLAEEERKRKEAKKQQMIGRNGYHLKGTEAILRGYKSQNSVYYDPESRNKQDIPNCIASVVMHSVLSIEDWNYRHIDLILDTGDQLYIDSYIAYGPTDPKLGMENIVRKFFMGTLEVHVTIYKPIITEVFTTSKLTMVLEAFFQQETVCVLNFSQLWVSVFFKGGFFYLFDPHERDMEGNIPKSGQEGTAVVVRFDNINAMALKIINNLGGNTDQTETFSLWIISVESK
ncbi:uncharacterized protein LOC126747451 [Anthonomus grandis grandis]|uniref:uncharacterized protein LOC126747451 n=1 Tax=Anthonomus grandis grandis TaxID=2921223 RepID=UPI002165C6A3|nr:uncharacterized protein LOC126747451 [Anthonomus grandis grandis]